jgi:hypothetical protein
VRASAALALSHAAKFIPAERSRAATALRSAWSQAKGELERRALALALVRFEDEAVSAEVRPVLCDWLAQGLPRVVPSWPFPWQRMDGADFVFCTTFLGTAEPNRFAVVLAASKGLAQVHDSDDAVDLACWLVRLALGKNPTEDVPRPADLDADAHTVLRAVVDAPAPWRYYDMTKPFAQWGLPTSRDDVSAWLVGATVR